MKSTVTFKEYFQTYYEDMTAGGVVGGSAGGFSPDSPTSSDFYAPGDARIATSSKIVQKRLGIIKVTTKKKRKKRK